MEKLIISAAITALKNSTRRNKHGKRCNLRDVCRREQDSVQDRTRRNEISFLQQQLFECFSKAAEGDEKPEIPDNIQLYFRHFDINF